MSRIEVGRRETAVIFGMVGRVKGEGVEWVSLAEKGWWVVRLD